MKKLFVFILFAALFFVACSGNPNKENNHQDGAHLHEDGTTHPDHDVIDTVKQEEFDVTQDSTQEQEVGQHHSHDGNEHSHQH